MYCRAFLRRFFVGTILLLLIYFIVFRRRAPRAFLTEKDLNHFSRQTVSQRRIPRIIHQTWRTRRVPDRWNRTVESVRRYNALEFEYRLWTDDDIHEFVREKEPNLYQHTFVKYPLNIQRVDAFRYVVLYHLGGIYIDMDNGCSQPFESLLDALETLDPQSTHLAAFPRTSPIGISNGFMISTQGHPLFYILISRLLLFNHNYLIDYLTVMMTAGPTYLSINEFYFSSESAVVRVIDETVYSSIYTWHTPGNSWHGRDAQWILYIYHRIRKLSRTKLTCVVLIFAFAILLIFCRRRKSR